MIVAAVGKMRRGPEFDLMSRYQSRLRPRLTVTEIAESRGSAQEIRRKDATNLLKATCGNVLRVALDEGGALISTVQFAQLIDGASMQGKTVAFMIGGAEGLDKSVLEASAHVISLSRMTWPHMMVRAMLAEQIYRAQTLASGHPYHRDSRP